MRRATRAGGWAALLLAAAPAHADDTEPIRIAVSAPPGCTDTALFTAEVSARTARARSAQPGEAARAFTVTITASAGKAHGTLVIDDPHGPGAARAVGGRTCAEVASALALVTALAIDPRASTATLPPPPPPPPPRPHPPPPAVHPAEPRPPPPPAPIPWWGPIGAPLPTLPYTWLPAPRWRVAAFLGVHAASALAPSFLPVFAGAVDVSRTGEPVSPSFRLTLEFADSPSLPVGDGAQLAHFRLFAARADACLRTPLVGPLSVSPCAFVEAGALRSEGITAFSPVVTTRPWVAPGLLARVQVDLVGWLILEAEGGATFPLVRDTFYFNPSLLAHEVPAAGGRAGGSVGFAFR